MCKAQGLREHTDKVSTNAKITISPSSANDHLVHITQCLHRIDPSIELNKQRENQSVKCSKCKLMRGVGHTCHGSCVSHLLILQNWYATTSCKAQYPLQETLSWSGIHGGNDERCLVFPSTSRPSALALLVNITLQKNEPV